jgi:hypothetical protein
MSNRTASEETMFEPHVIEIRRGSAHRPAIRAVGQTRERPRQRRHDLTVIEGGRRGPRAVRRIGTRHLHAVAA